VRDVVDLTWETLRLRRLKARLLTAVSWEGLKEVLAPLVGILEADGLSKDWAARDRQAVKKVDKLLASKRLSMDLAVARALTANIDSFERIDRMVMNAETRRNAVLRELERHRANLALALRRASPALVSSAPIVPILFAAQARNPQPAKRLLPAMRAAMACAFPSCQIPRSLLKSRRSRKG
jgi:hypothetical protein